MPRKTPKISLAYLEISSYTGISIGATHFYGKLIFYNGDKREDHELRRELSASEARLLNKIDDFASYRPGQSTERFDSREDVIAQAVTEYKTIFPTATALICGSSSTLDPQRVLDGPAELMKKLNSLHRQAERIDYWERNPSKMQEICDKWDLLIGKP